MNELPDPEPNEPVLNVLAERYASAAIRDIWSQRGRVLLERDFWIAVMKAQRDLGVPKTIDNDLPGTDHCPGYGSVIKYLSMTVREIACDNEAMGQGDLVSIVEVMGRSAGWIAAGTARCV